MSKDVTLFLGGNRPLKRSAGLTQKPDIPMMGRAGEKTGSEGCSVQV